MALAAADTSWLRDAAVPGGQQPSCIGLMERERPDAAVGIPKGRVAPGNGSETRIGIGDPGAVAQPQAVQRLTDPSFRTPRAAFPCTSTSMSNSHLRIGNGHADPGSKNGLQSRRQTRHRNNRRSMALDLKKGTIRRRGSKARTGPGA